MKYYSTTTRVVESESQITSVVKNMKKSSRFDWQRNAYPARAMHNGPAALENSLAALQMI